MSDNLPKTASEWIVRIHAGDMSLHDHTALEAWLAQSPSRLEEFRTAQKIWLVARMLENSPVGRSELQSLNISAPSLGTVLLGWTAHLTGRRIAALATAGALAMAAFKIFLPSEAPGLPALHNGEMAQTAINQITTYALPDGSTLTVNADSSVRLAFTREQRQVILERGEAFFDVRHNTGWPFVVTAGGRTVVVTGTKFDIDYGATDKAVEVAVVEGHVQVASAAVPTTTALPTNALIAGDVILFPEGKPGVPQKISADQVAAWRSRRLYFDQSSLSEVLTEVNRFTSKQLVLGDATLAGLKLSGYFRAGDIDAVIFSLTELYKIQVNDAGKTWVLTGTKDETLPPPTRRNSQKT